MKTPITLLCIIVLLVAATGTVAAAGPEPEQFTINGITTAFDQEPLPSGLAKFRATASGDVTGYFDGTAFTFEEWGIGSYNPDTMEARGVNHGIMTITNGPDNWVIIRFTGQADLLSVWGSYSILQSTGQYAGLRSEGTYQGSTDFGQGFSVEFSGGFHTQP